MGYDIVQIGVHETGQPDGRTGQFGKGLESLDCYLKQLNFLFKFVSPRKPDRTQGYWHRSCVSNRAIGKGIGSR